MQRIDIFTKAIMLLALIAVCSIAQATADNLYEPEYARITSGCWDVDVWNVPRSANESNIMDDAGNMRFYACNFPDDPNSDYYAPLYSSSFLIGWNDGTVHMYGDMVDGDNGFIALDSLTIEEIGNPAGGQGYYITSSSWATPDSCVQGTIQFAVPGHYDTAVIFERIVLWSECGTLNDFVIGEGIDWNMRGDTNRDDAVVDFASRMVMQRAFCNPLYDSCVGGMYVVSGDDGNLGAIVLKSIQWLDPNGYGYNPDSVYERLTTIDGTFWSESDTLPDYNSLYRFVEGDPPRNKTFEIITVKGVSCNGVADLIDLLAVKGPQFLYDNDPWGTVCQGICGDANGDASIDISDCVYIIRYAFGSGAEPNPRLACGDANGDGSVDISDAVLIPLCAFAWGPCPDDCSPGSWGGLGSDCCPY